MSRIGFMLGKWSWSRDKMLWEDGSYGMLKNGSPNIIFVITCAAASFLK